jgi:hypothetical protein
LSACLDGTAVQQPEPTFQNENGPIKPDMSGRGINAQLSNPGEPIIGQLKSDHRMGRCHLKSTEGDAIHAVLNAAGYNIRWLMRMNRKKGQQSFLRLIKLLVLDELLIT